MAGSWSQLSGSAAPRFPVGTMLLLTDGSVMCQECSQSRATGNWNALVADDRGDYTRGSWTQLSSLPADAPASQGGPSYAPLYYASGVLADGRVFLAGGEYNGPTSNADVLAAHVYDPSTDAWDSVPTPAGWSKIGDAPACVLADGRVLVGAIESDAASPGKCAIFDPATATWTPAAAKNNGTSSEETWTLLPDGSVLTVDCIGNPATEQYVPAQDRWLREPPTTVSLVEPNSFEIGPAIMLPDGRVLAIGAQNGTQLYTPPDDLTQPGFWEAGPGFPQIAGQVLGAKDAAAALLPNGRVLCAVGPVDGGVVNPDGQTNYLAPTYFFEFDPVASTMTEVTRPGTAGGAPYLGRMLLLPTGQVLFADCTTALWVYAPDGAPQPEWRPTITAVEPSPLVAGPTIRVSGTGFNGLSQAVSYGDDAQMATNYPLIRLTTSTGSVRYCRTFDHSTMAVATGDAIVRTSFVLPSDIAPGLVQLTVIANGIASAPRRVTVAGA